MVTIWHGSDQKSLYQNLNSRVLSANKGNIIRLTAENTKSDLLEKAGANNLFGMSPVILCENFISDKKVDSMLIKKLPQDTQIIFWEHEQVEKQLISKLTKTASIEEFKETSYLYQFLDSLKPGSSVMFNYLEKIDLDGNKSLLWQLSNRFLLLILAKQKLPFEKARETSLTLLHTNVYDWQWKKMQTQASFFEESSLKNVFSATLNADSLIKSGKTELPQKTLISLLLLKYL